MEKLIFRARSTGLSGLNVHNGQLASDLDHALSLVVLVFEWPAINDFTLR